MPSKKSLRNVGIAYLVTGLVTLPLAIVFRQVVLIGIAPGFIALGVVFLARVRMTA